MQVAASGHFMHEVFAPRAQSAGAEVLAVVVETSTNSSGAVICEYAQKVKADILVLMRSNKSAVGRFFMGSVTKYCAIHSSIPVVIVPPTAK